MPLTRPVVARNPEESHRQATPLELFYDLVSVVAIAAAVAGLHHAIANHHVTEGILTFIFAFFAIWWAWMNFTWYSSAYDNDDTVFRLLTLLIMSGALVMSAGITELFDSGLLYWMVVGFVIMRIGMIALWLRAANSVPSNSRMARTYAIGIFLVQLYWVGFAVFLAPKLGLYSLFGFFLIGAILELLVPVIAEQKTPSPWHRHHIIERYGLMMIIVLGETILSIALSLRQATTEEWNVAFIHIAVSAMLIVYSLWWLYFSREEPLESTELSRAITWGYGHFFVFASAAAVGAGLLVLVDVISGHAEVSLLIGNYAVAIPIALYMLSLWFVRDYFILAGGARWVLPIFALLMLLTPKIQGLELIAALCVLSVIVRSYVIERHSGAKS